MAIVSAVVGAIGAAVGAIGIGGTIAAGVAVAGTVASVNAQKKAAKEARRANDMQRRQNDLQAARQKREAIRAARIAYAQSQQGAENQGVAGSSASAGALGGISSQLNANLSFLDKWNTLSDQAMMHLGRASQYQANAAMYGAVADLAWQGASYAAKQPRRPSR